MSSISHLKRPELLWLFKTGDLGTGPLSEVSELNHILGNADTLPCTARVLPTKTQGWPGHSFWSQDTFS